MTRSLHARAGALLGATLLLASCSTADPADDDGEAPDASAHGVEMPAVPEGLDAFYEQDVAWEACGSFDCADVTVPMIYDEPDGETIEIAVKRRTADGDPIGSLFINPGGPGGSGTDLVDGVAMMFSRDLLEGFDVVGFDPRGVGESTAVECVSDAELDKMRATDYELDTPEQVETFYDAASDLAEACAANTGPLLGHVDTVSAAKDLDVLRHVLDEPRLDYLGYSYGTLLGATYADLFPQNVGRLALDGAVDPAAGSRDLVLGQAEGFERALHSYAEDCLAGSQCPLTGTVDTAVEQVQDLLELASHTPLPTGTDRELTTSLMFSGIILPLYDDALWPMLSSALDAAMYDNDGSQLLLLADLGAERESDGSYASNSTEAFTAINCLDYPVVADLDQMREDAETLEEISPTFGAALAFGDVGCEVWPEEATGERVPIAAEGAAPILVVGTTGDPATPYAWSQSLAEQLADATLVTYDGQGHTAYGRSNGCITDAVDAYLLRGTVPADGLTC
ncbi:alpha/beta hydrolase [Georgenia sp. MJ173]|uniref:alpha/beta hydrolase n=1 Tax=Georgenia sunbinii TaxID=3117728 RepID=UPI002F260268